MVRIKIIVLVKNMFEWYDLPLFHCVAVMKCAWKVEAPQSTLAHTWMCETRKKNTNSCPLCILYNLITGREWIPFIADLFL